MIRGAVEVLLNEPFFSMNAVGLVAFALVGATKAIRREFDLFGILVVGLATAFVGGMTRDVLVGRVPLALQSTSEIGLGVLGVAVAIGMNVALEAPTDHPLTVTADAIGLAAFTTAGAIVATDIGVSGFGVVAIATINAVGGGAFADILLDRSPFILLEDFYASCTVLGASTYWLVMATTGAGGAATVACTTVTIGTRLTAITCGWTLPTAQALGRIREQHGNAR